VFERGWNRWCGRVICGRFALGAGWGWSCPETCPEGGRNEHRRSLALRWLSRQLLRPTATVAARVAGCGLAGVQHLPVSTARRREGKRRQGRTGTTGILDPEQGAEARRCGGASRRATASDDAHQVDDAAKSRRSLSQMTTRRAAGAGRRGRRTVSRACRRPISRGLRTRLRAILISQVVTHVSVVDPVDVRVRCGRLRGGREGQ
jgi:hypothetical protein